MTGLLSVGSAVLAAGLLAAAQASAQEAVRPVNRFGLAYRAGLNIKASFNDLQPSAGIDAGAPVSGVNHDYEDGYNRVDVSGNANNLTWNWGYQNANQVPGDGFIYMHTSSSVIMGSDKNRSEDPQPGGELTYNREFGAIGKFFWGLELAANYTCLEISHSQNSAGSVSLVTDRYSLGGIVPPQPPYFGSPNPNLGQPYRISDIPTRTVELGTLKAHRRVEVDLYGFRLGPYIELPLSERFSAGVSGGLALGVIDSSFYFSETVTGAGVGKSLSRSGKKSTDDLLWGGFVNGKFSYQASHAWSFFVGGEFQDLGSFTQKASDREVKLDLGKSVYVTAGVGYSF